MTDDRTRGDGAALDEEVIDGETAEKLAEIEQTREAMHDTVEEIGDRLAPSSIVQNAKETVREATVGKVEDMAESAGQMFDEAGSSAQQAGHDIVETVRRNPIPAALAGIGIAWLVKNRSTGSTGSAMYRGGAWGTGSDRRREPDWHGQRYDRQVGYRIDSGPDAATGVKERIGEVGDTIGERAEEVGQRVGQVGDRVAQTIEQGVDRVGTRMSDVPDEMSYRMRDLGDQARSFLDQSPLAVGVVAVAVGTAVGAALPVTRTERRVLGPATERVIDTAERTATQALSDMEDSGQSSGQGSQSSGQSGQGKQGQGQGSGQVSRARSGSGGSGTPSTGSTRSGSSGANRGRGSGSTTPSTQG